MGGNVANGSPIGDSPPALIALEARVTLRRGDARRELCTARAHMLLEVVFWLPAWLARYAINDFGRVGRRIVGILEDGLALPGAEWNPRIYSEAEVDAAMPPQDPAAQNFLRVATRLINESGYRGASVLRIVEQLNVTKGSFYHHLDAKDDLVIACYQRSFDTIADAQGKGEAAGGSYWHRLSSVLATRPPGPGSASRLS